MKKNSIEHRAGSEKFLIEPSGDQFKLSVNPPNRNNGTESYDGWFPRMYFSQSSAKAALSRFIGEKIDWQQKKGG